MGDHGYYDDRHADADDWNVWDDAEDDTDDYVVVNLETTSPGVTGAVWYGIPDITINKGGIKFPMAAEMEWDMRTNDEILAEAQGLRDQATQLERVAADRDKYGADPFKNGTVMKVDMKYRTSTRSYAYAVIKIGGKFYLSGKMGAVGDPNVVATANSSRGYTWENFVAWLAQGDATVWQATGLKQVL